MVIIINIHICMFLKKKISEETKKFDFTLKKSQSSLCFDPGACFSSSDKRNSATVWECDFQSFVDEQRARNWCTDADSLPSTPCLATRLQWNKKNKQKKESKHSRVTLNHLPARVPHCFRWPLPLTHWRRHAKRNLRWSLWPRFSVSLVFLHSAYW